MASLVAIAAEFLSFDTARSGVRICVTHKATGSGVVVPFTVGTLHESTHMGPRIVSFDTIRVHMARQACGITTLNVMARSTAFDVTPRQQRMAATAAAGAGRHEKPCFVRMRSWSKAQLIHVPAGRMTGGTKSFFLMACLAILLLLLGGQSVGKPEIQVVNLGKSHSLAAVNRRQSRGAGRNHVLAGFRSIRQRGSVVAICACFLGMAAHTCCIADACNPLVLADEIRLVVFFGPQRGKIGVARLASIRCFHVIVARRARCHFRQTHALQLLGGIDILMTGLTFDLLAVDMRLVRELQLAQGFLEHIGCDILACMAIRAVFFHLVRVTRLAILVLGRQVIGSEFARRRSGVAIRAGKARLLDVEFVIELDLTRLRLVHAFQACRW